MFIPERFTRAVSVHVIKNLMHDNGVPLLLGIHGPSGEGKTYQCEKILAEMGVSIFLISGGQLESSKAGEPAELLRTTYLNAGRSIDRGECKSCAIVINDADTGLGDWGDMVQYTVNRQTVFGELMHLVDYPTMVNQRVTRRVPIILTGNDFTKLYGPLVRAGRFSSFEWKPTLDEKARMLSSVFPELDPEDCSSLVTELNKEAGRLQLRVSNGLPIAFYIHLRASLMDHTLWTAIQKVGLNSIVNTISNGRTPKQTGTASYDVLLTLGMDLVRSGQLLNHLGL